MVKGTREQFRDRLQKAWQDKMLYYAWQNIGASKEWIRISASERSYLSGYYEALVFAALGETAIEDD